jgi:hypothetical protein
MNAADRRLWVLLSREGDAVWRIPVGVETAVTQHRFEFGSDIGESNLMHCLKPPPVAKIRFLARSFTCFWQLPMG